MHVDPSQLVSSLCVFICLPAWVTVVEFCTPLPKMVPAEFFVGLQCFQVSLLHYSFICIHSRVKLKSYYFENWNKKPWSPYTRGNWWISGLPNQETGRFGWLISCLKFKLCSWLLGKSLGSPQSPLREMRYNTGSSAFGPSLHPEGNHKILEKVTTATLHKTPVTIMFIHFPLSSSCRSLGSLRNIKCYWCTV